MKQRQMIELQFPYTDETPIAFIRALELMGINCRFPDADGNLLVTMGQEEWDRVYELRCALRSLGAQYVQGMRTVHG